MNNSSNDKLASAPLGSLMASMAIPSIVAQIINILYNIIDRIYIGHIPGAGARALTGVGVTFPIIVFISAFSAFAGAGGAPLSSIWLGKGDRKRAEQILGNSTFLLILFSAILMAVFYCFKTPMLYAFGASQNTIEYADSYISVYLIGTVFVELALGLNTYIIAQGRSATAMISVLIGAVLNIVLDPIFIFVLNMGVAGAAWATIISQAVSALWVTGFLMSKKAALKLKLGALKPDINIIKGICALGISTFTMRATESLISVVMNHGLLKYGGDLYVGSLTIMQSVMQFLSTPLAGFTQGVSPIISYSFGAGLFDRVRRTYRRMIGISGAFSFCAALLAMLFPAFFASWFTSDTELIGLVSEKMPLFMSGMLIFGVQMGIQPTFLALGQAKQSMFIAMLRKVFLLVPLALILPLFFGADGVYIAEPVSDIASALTASGMFLYSINKVLSKETLDNIN
ncbi:MAG: MATE family efflux transporter [Clostridiales bacterium]|nr:MATE family efflux transporter [Clostridiales bacterium]